MKRIAAISIIFLLFSLSAGHAMPGRFQCHATSISDFADDPVYRIEKRQALAAGENFEADMQTGFVKSKDGKTEKWQIVEKGDPQTDAVLMRQKNYKTLPIDEFISIMRWSGNNDDGYHFERSILDGMISGVCTPLGYKAD
jgi:hypothetical protein